MQTYGDSLIFADDWFGSASPDNSFHTVDRGRWAYLPVMTVSDHGSVAQQLRVDELRQCRQMYGSEFHTGFFCFQILKEGFQNEAAFLIPSPAGEQQSPHLLCEEYSVLFRSVLFTCGPGNEKRRLILEP